MTSLEYLLNMKDALPFSSEKPCTRASNSEIRRWIQQGSVLFNTEKVTFDELIDFPVFSLVFFPKSFKRKTTLI